jgi:RNA polymerase sigma-70 factor (ECF subfamily)
MTHPHSLERLPADAVHPSPLPGRTPKVISLTRPEPAPLLPRIAAGDTAAVAQCIAEFGPMVLVLARRWSRDEADAEDAVQEVFFDLWKHAGRFDAAKASERGYVAMIARRRLIDRLRKRGREVMAESMPDGFDAPDEGEEPGAQVAGAMDARAVLDRLTPMQRRCIELHLLDGKTHEEIARESQVPLGTVKSHIRRGLSKARALLTGRVTEDAS